MGLRLSRGLFAVLGLAALCAQGQHSIASLGLSAGHYFSFFTIQSNLLTVAVLLCGAISPGFLSTQKFDLLRGAVVLYLMITGVVYSLLLSHLPEVQAMMVPWADVVLHRLMPLWVLADWLIVPPSDSFTLRQALAWLAFPFAYMVYSLIRGAVVHWYPYPFLDPAQPGGVLSLTGYCLGISLFGLFFTWVIVKVGQLRRSCLPIDSAR